MIKKVLVSTPAALVASFLVGYAFHSIRGVTDPRSLWVGNLSWPYILVPALACAGRRTMRSAVVRAVGATVSMVLGFYNVLGLFVVSDLTMGLEPGTPRATVIVTAWREYLVHLVLGLPGGIPWITVGALSGALLAVVHRLGVNRGAGLVFWSGVALVGVLEPLLHFAPVFAFLPFGGYRFDADGQVIAVTECLVGVALLVTVVLQRRSGHLLGAKERWPVR